MDDPTVIIQTLIESPDDLCVRLSPEIFDTPNLSQEIKDLKIVIVNDAEMERRCDDAIASVEGVTTNETPKLALQKLPQEKAVFFVSEAVENVQMLVGALLDAIETTRYKLHNIITQNERIQNEISAK